MSRWTARELDAEQTASLSGEPGMVLATLRPGAMPQRWQPPEEARGGTAPAGAAPEIPAPLPAPVPAPVPVAMPRPAPPPAPGAPAATAPPVAAGVDLRSIAELLQAELRRVGCYAGPVDGSWGRSSAEAVQRFNERTRSSLDAAAPGLDAVKAVSERAARVCPLSCPTGQTADGDHCVAVLPVRARPAAPPPPAPAAPQGAGQKCSVFAGMRYCE
jgi:hypothetical protein